MFITATVQQFHLKAMDLFAVKVMVMTLMNLFGLHRTVQLLMPPLNNQNIPVVVFFIILLSLSCFSPLEMWL